ncbi:MAG TPA: cytochrome c peroxidase [Flavisolibacter sp.]
MRAALLFLILAAMILGGSALLQSCRRQADREIRYLDFVVPPGFPQPVHNFSANPLTEDGFILGRKLFYDGRLSADGMFPCGSCHQPVAAFTTFEHDRSHGYNNSHTLRNAPGLFNLAWYPVFNQDGSGGSLAEVFRAHITHPQEMAETIPGIISKIKQDAYYLQLFRQAFGDQAVTEDRIYKAMEQFFISLVSADSKYDKVFRGQATFTPEEQSGYNVFKAKCNSCHKEPLFTDFTYRNTGLPVDAGLNDYGRMRVTNSSADSLKFRVPSLRNAELTSYYAHDGRLSVFRMMIQHYRSGVIQSPTLDPQLVNGIPLTTAEENELVAFIRTLTDSTFLNNPRFRQ